MTGGVAFSEAKEGGVQYLEPNAQYINSNKQCEGE